MEDYKQKYEQALDNFKKIKAANKDNKELVDFIEYEYPELKESEDEKMRKMIIQVINITPATIARQYRKEMLDWLEKQEDANKEYWRGYREGKQEIIDKYSELEKQGEQNPAWSEEDEYNLNWIINDYERASQTAISSAWEGRFKLFVDWLKSLKERVKGK